MSYLEHVSLRYEADIDRLEQGFLMAYLGNQVNASIVCLAADSRSELSRNQEQSFEGQVVNKQDFHSYAERHGLSSVAASRNWNNLTRLQNLKANPDLWSNEIWYDPADYADMPLVFGQVPESSGAYVSSYEAKLSDLDLDSLDQLVKKIDAEVEGSGPEAIGRRLGNMAGPKTLEFYRDYINEKRQGVISLDDFRLVLSANSAVQLYYNLYSAVLARKVPGLRVIFEYGDDGEYLFYPPRIQGNLQQAADMMFRNKMVSKALAIEDVLCYRKAKAAENQQKS